MMIYIIYSGPLGEQMVNTIATKEASEIVNVYELKPETIEEEHPSETNIWSKIWETPEEYIPRDLPILECDLLLVIGIHPKLGDIIPPIAEKLKAKAVLYPIDDKAHAPEAKKSVENDLEARKIYVEFPEPFCTLEKSKNPYIDKFAKIFGRPKFEIKLDRNKKTLKDVKVIRNTPCGSAFCVSKKLANFPYQDRAALIKKILDEHHNESAENYCLAEMDPHHPLMQEAGDLLKDAVFEAAKFSTTKDAILKIIDENGVINIKKLEKIIVGEPGVWKDQYKACDADRTFYLYIDELIKEGKILRTKNGKLRLM